MPEVQVLFFAADPLSAPPGRTPRLLLDEDLRQIKEKVRAADYRDVLTFDLRLAARADDLLQALNERHPQVVHFSGHGGTEGLMLMAANGHGAHSVDASALRQLFEVFRGDIRLVVLSACFSHPQAEAIASVVGCAIGTRGEISDQGAITFNASFYRAIAFGHSVKVAYDQAKTALALNRLDRECPDLVVRPGVDASELVLIPPGDVESEPASKAIRPPARKDTDPPEALAVATDIPPRPITLLPQKPSTVATADAPSQPPPHPAVVTRSDSAPQPQRALGLLAAGGPATVSRRDWLFVAGVWLASLGSAKALGVGTAQALALSAVPYLVTYALLRHARSPAARGAVRPAVAGVAALMLSAAAVLAGVSAIRWAAPLAAAQRQYHAQRYAPAFRTFQRMAAEGNGEAMGFLGIMFLAGQGTPPRPDEGMVWLQRAIGRGDARAMYAWGIALETGEGVAKNPQEAMRMYDSARAHGSVEAMNKLGEMYRQMHGGQSEAQGYQQALGWYGRAAEAGSVDGMVNLGLMHERGLGTRRDPARARGWYRRAADRGSSQAMVHLGWMYESGTGVRRDDAQARAWYRKAARAGSADGMNDLGLLLANGRGGAQDLAEAVRWFTRADAAGSPDAKANLDSLGVRPS
jgi:TPR repeat protein